MYQLCAACQNEVGLKMLYTIIQKKGLRKKISMGIGTYKESFIKEMVS